MPVQRVADVSGDTRFEFKVDNEAEVAKAMERFNELVNNRRYTAYNPGQNGEAATLLRTFDPTVEETVFMPQKRGG